MPYLSSSTNSLDSDMCGVAEGGERNQAELNLNPAKKNSQSQISCGGAGVHCTVRVDKG